MTLVSKPLVGLEQIQRAAFYSLFDRLNDVITEVETYMNASDEEFATHTGRLPYVPTDIERIADEHFYEGHRPSLIKAPPENYPNISVMAVRSTPGPESELLDQVSVYRDSLFIEVMVKSIASEEEVNRRLHRTAEAVNICIMQDPTLGGVVTGLDGTPSIILSDVFTRKERTSYGPEWLWQGARIEHAVRKETVTPHSTIASLFIDQA